jgi:hypothetical protein
MPISQQQNARKNAFDRKHFDEILQCFNAATAKEVDAAFCDALRICDRLQMPFRDVVQHVYGHDERLTELQDELTEALEDRLRRDKERSRLAEQLAELRGTCSALTAANQRLQQGARFCPACERLRRVLAVIAGLLVGAAWLRLFLPHGLRPWSLIVTAVLTLGPLAIVFWRWHWLLLSRKIKYVSRTDNDLIRWWKGLA